MSWPGLMFLKVEDEIIVENVERCSSRRDLGHQQGEHFLLQHSHRSVEASPPRHECEGLKG